jgi:hypothetical protein
MSSAAGFLLDGSGRRFPADQPSLASQFGLVEGADLIDHAVRHRGFVFLQPAHKAVFIELSPSKAEPLAVLGAVHEIKDTRPDCVILDCPGEWRRSPYEFFASLKAALQRMDAIARSASKRTATKVRSRAASYRP